MLSLGPFFAVYWPISDRKQAAKRVLKKPLKNGENGGKRS
jgi:hypothetical protein